MKTTIIYDNTGYIISVVSGEPTPYQPSGIPFLNIEIPEGKRLKIVNGVGVDTSVTPHQVILEDIPPTEIDVLKEDTSTLAEMTATTAEDNTSLADTLATVLLEIENIKADISALKGV